MQRSDTARQRHGADITAVTVKRRALVLEPVQHAAAGDAQQWQQRPGDAASGDGHEQRARHMCDLVDFGGGATRAAASASCGGEVHHG